MKAPEDMRVWVGGGVAASLVVAAAGWFLLVSPELSTIPAWHAEADSAQLENAVLQGKIATLKRQSAQLPALVASLRTAREKLPITASLPAAINQLNSQARTAKVAVTSLSIASPTVVTAGAASTAASGTDTGTTHSDTSAAATPTTSAAAGSSDATAGTTAGTTAGSAGPAGQLFAIQLTVITSGSLKQQNAFLAALQYGGARAALVTSVQLGSGQGSESATLGLASSMTTQVAIFVAPQTPAVAAQLAKQLSSRPIR